LKLFYFLNILLNKLIQIYYFLDQFQSHFRIYPSLLYPIPIIVSSIVLFICCILFWGMVYWNTSGRRRWNSKWAEAQTCHSSRFNNTGQHIMVMVPLYCALPCFIV